MRYFLITVTLLFLSVIAFLGKRSDTFIRPPWQVFPDMDDMEKYHPQRNNTFHANGMNDRPVPANTVVRGNDINLKDTFSEDYSNVLYSDDPKTKAINTGLDANGELYRGFPIEVNEANLQLGHELYDRYCTICHGAAGDGIGVTYSFGYKTSANFHDPVRAFAGLGKPEGGIFKVLTEGYLGGATGMISFADRLTPEERWAVTLHVRALQHMRVAQDDVQKLPTEVIQNITSLQVPQAPVTPESN
jgi:mono/diheme cytochrome c family protein